MHRQRKLWMKETGKPPHIPWKYTCCIELKVKQLSSSLEQYVQMYCQRFHQGSLVLCSILKACSDALSSKTFRATLKKHGTTFVQTSLSSLGICIACIGKLKSEIIHKIGK